MGNISMPNIVLFIGAGASQPLELPTTQQLSSILHSKLSDESRKLWIKLNGSKDAEDVIGQINALLKVKPNIRFFQEFLREAGESKNMKDIMVQKFQLIFKSLSKDTTFIMSEIRKKHLYSSFNSVSSEIYKTIPELFSRIEKLSQEIYNLIFSVYELSQEMESKAIALYKPLFEILNPWRVNTILPIFTTNYDRVIPTVLDGLGYDFVDGFRRKRRRRYFDRNVYEKNRTGVHLFHLQGAINWRRTRNNQIEWLPTGERVTSSRIYKENVLMPLGSNEYPYEEPFKTGYDYLRKYLEIAGKCVVIGYSFRNDHINNIFREAFATNENLCLARIAPTLRLKEVFPEAHNISESIAKFGGDNFSEAIHEILEEEISTFIIEPGGPNFD